MDERVNDNSGQAIAAGAIEVRVSDISQLFDTLDPFPFPDRDLDKDAEEFIVGWARELPRDHPLKIVLHMPASEIKKCDLKAVGESMNRYFGYRVGLDRAQSDDERNYIRRFYRRLTTWLLGFWAGYGVLLIGAKQFVVSRHLVYSSVAIGLVLPFTCVLFASGIFWLRAPGKFLAELTAKGVTLKASRPAWEYRAAPAAPGPSSRWRAL